MTGHHHRLQPEQHESSAAPTVTDVLSDGVVCSVTGGADVTDRPGEQHLRVLLHPRRHPAGAARQQRLRRAGPTRPTRRRTRRRRSPSATSQFDAGQTVQARLRRRRRTTMHGTLAQHLLPVDAVRLHRRRWLAVVRVPGRTPTPRPRRPEDTKVDLHRHDNATLTVCCAAVARRRRAPSRCPSGRARRASPIVKTGTSPRRAMCNAGTYLRTFVPVHRTWPRRPRPAQRPEDLRRARC